ncbi:ARM repeat-containing protein [Piedraia hortae CBS 480.64]|uniref:ARM repeat-containing protein n=1 Tax=Piedraia hortae CBS 480.64 TaxID=1314780 RepID=A0A6A7BXA5_9PEZI|nr:ARM repeat-containing protein [Piedraia hortae CBS 480.64]
MDASQLRSGIQATLDGNAEVRQHAEAQLQAAEKQTGFLNALLDVLETEQDNAVRVACVVYFKNRINRGWLMYGGGNAITEQEKAVVRPRLVPALARAPANTRAQLVVALQKVLNCDFPKQWPQFVDLTLGLLNTRDVSSVFAGLQCLLGICRVYRLKMGDSRAEFDQIVAATFPQMHQIATSLVAENSMEAGEMLRITLKAYRQAIYFELPAPLRPHDAMVNWCTLFLQVVAKEPPECSMMDDIAERELNHWWKAKKAAYGNLNRLFIRYGNPVSLGKSSGDEYIKVAESFITNFAPEILKSYFAEIEKWVQRKQWLSKHCLASTLAFMEECVRPKATWDHLRPHMKVLISHLIFPVMCQSNEDLEQFDDDPAEYLHRKLNFFEETYSPDMSAQSFLTVLAKHRRKQVFEVLSFVNNIVNAYEAAPEESKNAREKEGALRMIGTLADTILGPKSPIADQVEYFFVRHVFPEFRSPHGFLRARACTTLERFEKLNFADGNNLVVVYRNILESMADECLPVRVAAALALQSLIRHEPIKALMQQNIPQVMQQLLKLTNEVDVDALANVMEEFVGVFAEELAPFAVALTVQLKDTYLRIVGEMIARNQEKDEEVADYMDDKSITALGVLQTIGTLILTLESKPSVVSHLEEILLPLITVTLQHKLYDLYNEIFEIIDSCTFSSKAISPYMWTAFSLMHQTYKAGAELYLEDMLPALENFVTYGGSALLQNPPFLDAVMDMTRTIFVDTRGGGGDKICGCRLAEIMMLNLRGGIDHYIPELIAIAMGELLREGYKSKSYRVHLMEMVINAVYYNPRLAMRVLEGGGWTDRFFGIWFAHMEMFTRFNDKKLCIVGISSLLGLRTEEIPASVRPGWPRLMDGLVALFRALPQAEQTRNEARQEEDLGPTAGDVIEDFAADGEWENEDDGDVRGEREVYLDFLGRQANNLEDDDDDEDDALEEDLLDSPLDKVEVYGLFKSALHALSLQDSQLYNSLINSLKEEDKQVIKGAIDRADELERERAELAEQDHQANST